MYKNLSIEEIISLLDKKNNILFGPFLGSYSWEISNWSGFVRWYMRQNPDKNYVVCTRKSRKGLYDFNTKFEFFEFEEEEKMNEVNFMLQGLDEKMYDGLMYFLNGIYGNYCMLEPSILGNREFLFDYDYQSFDIQTPKSCQSVITSILNKNKNLIPICVFPKYKQDTNYRNWIWKNWESLFDILSSSGVFAVFSCGLENKNHYKILGKPNVYDINEINSKEILNTSISGLTVECIKRSIMTVGVESANVILSHMLKKPSIFWGHDNERYLVDYNPYGINSVGLKSLKYDMNPGMIANEISNLLKNRK